MKKKFIKIAALFLVILFSNCTKDTAVTAIIPEKTTVPTVVTNAPKQLSYLALGDSYTIGQSVCETCRFPEQLKKSLGNLYPVNSYSLKIIAQTGWTTTNLISAINAQNLTPNYDLVTLLIGVNNQYQNLYFQTYQYEFPELVNKAITLAKGDKTNVIVVSIPDYAFTPF